MKRSMRTFTAIALGAAVLCALLLGGCLGDPAAGANNEQSENRAYMSQVNEIMDELSEAMHPFVEAVSSQQAVSIRSQADTINRTLDKLAALEAPEDLVDIKESYDEGTDKLRQALDSYLTLYNEVQNGSFDWSTYDTRRQEIQDLYDAGVQALEKGDSDAAEL